MKTFKQFLKNNQMRYTNLVDKSFADDLENSWEAIAGESGTISDAETDEILDAYLSLGLIEPLETKKRSAASQPMGIGAAPPVPADPAAGNGPARRRPSTRPSYAVLYSSAEVPDAHNPILILEDADHTLRHHEMGDFTNPDRKNAFEFKHEQLEERRILAADSRFIKLLNWLGKGHISVRLSGYPVQAGYAVYKIRAVDPNGNESLTSANNSFLQLVIRRLLSSGPVVQQEKTENEEEAPEILLSDMPGMIDFMSIAGDTLPSNIRAWAYRNIALINAGTISEDEKRHAQRSLSMMLNIQWQSSWFPSVDPEEARRILDEKLYGMNRVKQRVIETIIQINRTHTLPGYGLLLVGPAGTGKSQIAYAVAKILKLPWFSLDMSTIHDAEALTGSPRVYTNAKPGRIMEAFSYAGSSNLVFIINELDKADSGNSASNPADTLLTLLDGLGFTDNYIECSIPTNGVYPIATANDKSHISDPLLSRFAVIDIPDYTSDERKIIFRDYVMPRILRRLGMQKKECSITPEGVDAIIKKYADLPGVRSLEQAGEHIAANALYRIETEKVSHVVYDREDIQKLLDD